LAQWKVIDLDQENRK